MLKSKSPGVRITTDAITEDIYQRIQENHTEHTNIHQGGKPHADPNLRRRSHRKLLRIQIRQSRTGCNNPGKRTEVKKNYRNTAYGTEEKTRTHKVEIKAIGE